MDVLRRNTDYAFRAILHLARDWKNETVSTREMALEEDIPYPLACKLMQKLHKSKLVESSMGPKGGFGLSKGPSKISLMEIIKAVQGPVKLSRCLLDVDICPRRPRCPVSKKLAELQELIESYFCRATLDELLQSRGTKKKNIRKRKRRKK